VVTSTPVTGSKPTRTTRSATPFASVPTLNRLDLPALERRWLKRWQTDGTMERYLHRNDGATKQFRFIDGPITANNMMGVHHAWNRAYKDIYQRFHTMLGERQRYQNGFDCQGLWVEVEVEREFGFKSKRDIEEYGIAAFVERCKERVLRFAKIITDQSKRLGYWMFWDNSYFTMSEENNYTIWYFLKVCHERGLIYKGRDSMPWCPRCATGISDMEINDGRKEVQHTSVYVRFPLRDRQNEYLLVWTTTPWTLPANVAAAVNPDLVYAKVEQDGNTYYLCKDLVPKLAKLRGHDKGDYKIVDELSGADMVGWTYNGPFDELPAWKDQAPQYAKGVVEQGDPYVHRVIPWRDVAATEGTGIVHIAPGCGREDFQLGKEQGVRILAPIDESGTYYDGYGWLTGQYVNGVARGVMDNLKEKGIFYQTESIKHVYPHCWRCGTELVFRNVEEWFISMGPKEDPERKGLRYEIMDVVNTIRWLPDFGLERELDWLRNMEDWMISKKRYWGLALPIFDCAQCGHFMVIGSETELHEHAISGWEEFEGHTPHRPYVDAVKVACTKCGAPVERIKDVGNPWLDAGIVPYSTLNYRHDREYWREWFPAQFITESFPGQFRNWFYSLLVMSTVLENTRPFETVLGFASVTAHDGTLMSKSKGTAVWFKDAAERVGADTMRWLYATQQPEKDVWFPLIPTQEEMEQAKAKGTPVRLNEKWLQIRSTLDKLWNVYYFFVTYANIDKFDPTAYTLPPTERDPADLWLLAEEQETISEITAGLLDYDSVRATTALSEFVDQLSNWYIRRARRRFWKSEMDNDKIGAFLTLYETLVTTTKLIAPFTPFLAEELYTNLTRASKDPALFESVHLADWPTVDTSLVNDELRAETRLIQRVVNLGRAAREQAEIRVRQPLPTLYVRVDDADRERIERLASQALEELNVKTLRFLEADSDMLTATVKPRMATLGRKYRSRVQHILTALKSVSPAAAHALRVNGTLPLTLTDGTQLALTAEDLEVQAGAREGFVAAEDRGLVVVLDTHITPELRDEGLVRDLTHHINTLRKQAGFAIEDHIDTVIVVDEALGTTVNRFADYVRDETLTRTLTVQAEKPDADDRFRENIPADKLGGHAATIILSKTRARKKAVK
jgi:isoleucyl-tRNA synthetase